MNQDGVYDEILEEYRVVNKLTWEENNNLKISKKDEQIWKLPYSKNSTIPEFIKELRKLNKLLDEKEDIRFYCQTHPLETQNLIFQFYSDSTLQSDQRFYLHCLKSDKNQHILRFLIHELWSHDALRGNFGLMNDTINNFFINSADEGMEEKYISTLRSDINNKYLWGIYDILIKINSKNVREFMLEISKNKQHFYYHNALEYIQKEEKLNNNK